MTGLVKRLRKYWTANRAAPQQLDKLPLATVPRDRTQLENSQSARPAAPARSRLERGFLLAHPWLLAVVPILHLYSQNINEASGTTAIIFAGGTLTLTTVLLGPVWFWQRSLTKASLVVSLLMLLFYAYGHIFDLVMQHEPVRLQYNTWHAILLVSGLALVLFTGLVMQRTRRNLQPACQFLSCAMLILVLMCLAQIGSQSFSGTSAGSKSDQTLAATKTGPSDEQRVSPLAADSPETPDVYYIILDGYARADTLKRVCRYDNSAFIEALRSRGFYVADQSSSNYPMTFMSLASSLNMCYLDKELQSPGYADVYAMWDRPEVARVFQSKGYRFVYLGTNFRSTLAGVDILLARRPEWLLNQFAETLLRTSALRYFEPQMADQHLYQFEKTERVADVSGPTFTFCHLIAPHPPYVFDRSGRVCCDVPQSMFFKDGAQHQQNAASEQARAAYVEQLMFINDRIEQCVNAILARSSVIPIIIIQGDHGTFFTLPDGEWNDDKLDRFAEERLPILNAYLVPETMRRKLHPDISPVNSFRLLFNECFGDRFELLPEKHLVGWYYGMDKLRDATHIVHAAAVQAAEAIATQPAAVPR